MRYYKNEIVKKVTNVFLLTSLLFVVLAVKSFYINETNVSDSETYDFRKDIKIRKYSDIC